MEDKVYKKLKEEIKMKMVKVCFKTKDGKDSMYFRVTEDGKNWRVEGEYKFIHVNKEAMAPDYIHGSILVDLMNYQRQGYEIKFV